MRRLLRIETLPILATASVCLVLYVVAGLRFEGFFTVRVALNFLTDNAFLGVISVGLTFVILTGGIDLSIGSMVGLSGILTASLVEHRHWNPVLVIIAVLLSGALLGLAHGVLITRYQIAPFLATLAGLFLCRGLALWVSSESIQIKDPFFSGLARFSIAIPGGGTLTLSSLIFVAVLVLGIVLAKQTAFGRSVYAIGGSREAAVLMGLPVIRHTVLVYVLSGVCSALGGIVFAIYTSSGNAIAGTGMELDAIAAVVVGGSLLSGGYGSVFGTFLGVLILAIIQTGIMFQGTLSSWWIKIATGFLLLMFMMLQQVLARSGKLKGQAVAPSAGAAL